MTYFVFGLVLLSATMHVFWNTLVKTSEDKASFAFLTTLASTLVLLPFFIASRFISPGSLSPEVWFWALLSGVFEGLYTVFLFTAYRKADLSVVYPLSRGIAPMVTLLLGFLISWDSVGPGQAVTVGIIFTGVLGVSFSATNGSARRDLDIRGILFSVGTGCMIAGYHLVDRRALSLGIPPNPLEYLFLMHLFLLAFVSTWVCAGLGRSMHLFTEWENNRKSVLIVGAFAPLAYLLIMVALKYGNVTGVAAGRNIGIVISTLVGALILKERVTARRTVGTVIIAMGVIGLVLITGKA